MKKHIFFLLATFATCTLGFGQITMRDDLRHYQATHSNATLPEQQPMAVPVNFHNSTKNVFPINSTRLTPKGSAATCENLAASAGKSLLTGAKSLKKGRYAIVGAVVVWLYTTQE